MIFFGSAKIGLSRFTQSRFRQHIQFNSSGFTLVELLIAIAIFAMIALGTATMFSSVKTSNELSEKSLSNLQDIQRAMLIIERDLMQMIARPPRVQLQDNKLIVAGGNFEFDSDEGSIAFVRNGWHNPQMMLPRSSMQRVIYLLQDKVLIRQYFTHVDAVAGTEPKSRELLKDISDFAVELAFEYNDKELVWSDSFESETLPIAARIVITSDVYGEIERIFQVAP